MRRQGFWLGATGIVATIVLSAFLAVRSEEPARKDGSGETDLEQAAHRCYDEALTRLHAGGQVDSEQNYLWSKRWLKATQAVHSSKEARLIAAKAHLQRMEQLENQATGYRRAGMISQLN